MSPIIEQRGTEEQGSSPSTSSGTGVGEQGSRVSRIMYHVSRITRHAYPKGTSSRITHHLSRIPKGHFVTHHPPRITLIALILLAAWLRLWQLDTIPPGLWFDESLNAMEAVWMVKHQSWPVFILNGQGREVMFHYLLAASISLFGQSIYPIRLVPALLGVLSIPLMYRWALVVFDMSWLPPSNASQRGNIGKLRSWPSPQPSPTGRGSSAFLPREELQGVLSSHRWLAIIGAAGLAVSFWYLVMNRVGYRANALLPLMLATGYFFWRGWQSGQLRYYLLAGVGVGLCQYTYLAGRLVPLIFVVFVALQTIFCWRQKWRELRTAWLGLLLMGVVAGLVFLPMFLFFLDYPELLWTRSGDVSLKISWDWAGLAALAGNIVAAIRVFIDGQDPNWRHHLLGRPGLDIFSLMGFWIGLLIALKNFRQDHNMFLLTTLGVMWLPAPLTEPAFHTLRLVGILPAYYALSALGWLAAIRWLGRVARAQAVERQAGLIVLVAVIVISGGVTVHRYFYRWADLPQVYQAFDGPVVDLAQKLVSQDEVNAIIPFYLYTHASMRYLLDTHFAEATFLPQTEAAKLTGQPQIDLIIPTYPEDDGKPPAFVWLTKDKHGPGQAHVSAVVRGDKESAWLQKPSIPLENERGNLLARQYQLDSREVASIFAPQLPQKKTSVNWGDNLLLSGYEFIPPTIQPGQTSQLYLSWQILGYTELQERMFLQFLDRQGHPVGQVDVAAISRKMYRWREDGLILELYPLNFEVDLAPGLYFVRLGFFDPESGQRLAANSPSGRLPGDELIVGPLYLKAGRDDPTTPQYPVQAKLGDKFELLGYSIYPLPAEDATEIELFWQALASADVNYTVFLQALDNQNQVIAQVDAQPLPNLYPTSRWQPGDIVSERFVLPIDSIESPNRVVTGLYDLSTGARLPVYDAENVLQPDGVIELLEP